MLFVACLESFSLLFCKRQETHLWAAPVTAKELRDISPTAMFCNKRKLPFSAEQTLKTWKCLSLQTTERHVGRFLPPLSATEPPLFSFFVK
ncbi:hypothetical protein NPIL_182071 [Nephila pilipes]|uniref:Uncharacterized protein n=1 Tax=Nephila pilipes TaxID=299642 RepID=A0A8X6PHK1_NEPPI|nr:hypothetical protein NPIL_182071 [Nephila pilipes]